MIFELPIIKGQKIGKDGLSEVSEIKHEVIYAKINEMTKLLNELEAKVNGVMGIEK